MGCQESVFELAVTFKTYLCVDSFNNAAKMHRLYYSVECGI
jgi:hypothetical protein